MIAGAATIDANPLSLPMKREEVGVVGDLRLALPFLIGDEVVDGGERDLEPVVEERGDEVCG